MPRKGSRDDFGADTKAVLAKRAGFMCSICRAVTVGPSQESAASVCNVGVAAHITAASPGGPRYNKSLTASARADVTNGIWLCQTHAKLIDDDSAKWGAAQLLEAKRLHEESLAQEIGVPQQVDYRVSTAAAASRPRGPVPREYAFFPLQQIIDPYRKFITPIVKDKGLEKVAELGVLMCGTPQEDLAEAEREPQWTVFVNADWLRWYLKGQGFGHCAIEIPGEQIYGQIPAWPDGFFEFLAALVKTNGVFVWRRHPKGYLMLGQP